MMMIGRDDQPHAEIAAVNHPWTHSFTSATHGPTWTQAPLWLSNSICSS
jgi:hypothetical protein